LIELSGFLTHHGITREQFVDLAILVGTDFNEGIKGIGPKTALKLIRQYGRLEGLPQELTEKLRPDFDTLRSIFLRPNVRTDYSTGQRPVDEQALFRFLCDERGFSRDRVEIAVGRMRAISERRADVGLRRWMGK
jgi:flap endonuclease-1